MSGFGIIKAIFDKIGDSVPIKYTSTPIHGLFLNIKEIDDTPQSNVSGMICLMFVCFLIGLIFGKQIEKARN